MVTSRLPTAQTRLNQKPIIGWHVSLMMPTLVSPRAELLAEPPGANLPSPPVMAVLLFAGCGLWTAIFALIGALLA